jgi:hypothetical protein
MARLQYLYNAGLFDEKKVEVAHLRDILRPRADQTPDIWLMESVFQMKDGDRTLAKVALDRYLVLTNGGQEAKAPIFEALKADLNNPPTTTGDRRSRGKK